MQECLFETKRVFEPSHLKSDVSVGQIIPIQ